MQPERLFQIAPTALFFGVSGEDTLSARLAASCDEFAPLGFCSIYCFVYSTAFKLISMERHAKRNGLAGLETEEVNHE